MIRKVSEAVMRDVREEGRAVLSARLGDRVGQVMPIRDHLGNVAEVRIMQIGWGQSGRLAMMVADTGAEGAGEEE